MSGDTDEPRSAAFDRLQPHVTDRFGIDTRGLAGFRIAAGLLLLADLLLRARDMRAFYTDLGVLPRGALAELFPGLAAVSLHTLAGGLWGQRLLFVIAGGVVCLLLVGYRTRIAAVGAWVLLASLQARNPYVLNGGDTVMLVVLFLAVFLPLGDRWSVDALRHRPDSRQSRTVVSVASATILLQVVLVYLSNAAYKFRSDLWMEGLAVRYIFELDQFTVLLGPYLPQYPGLLVAVNWAWVGLLAAAWLLVAATGRLRIAVVLAFVVAHVGMLLTMRLGLFPLVMIATLLLFVPATVWDAVEARVGAVADIPAGRLGERLAHGPADDANGTVPPSLRRWGRLVASMVVAAVLVSSIAWQAAGVGYVDAPEAVTATVDPVEYSWKMFAPNPPVADGWFVAPATLASGETVDALEQGPVEWDRPPDVSDAYPTALWHRYLTDMRWGSDAERRYLAAYLCRETAATQGEPVRAVTLYYLEEPTRLDGPSEIRRLELLEHECGADGHPE